MVFLIFLPVLGFTGVTGCFGFIGNISFIVLICIIGFIALFGSRWESSNFKASSLPQTKRIEKQVVVMLA